MSCLRDICGEFEEPDDTENGCCHPPILQRKCGIPDLYLNEYQSYTLECEDDQVGDPAVGEVQAGEISSPFGVNNANGRAEELAQERAEAIRAANPCVWANGEQSCTETCPEGMIGDPITVTINAGTYTSTISQADADAQALAAACEQAALLRDMAPCTGQEGCVCLEYELQTTGLGSVGANGNGGTGGLFVFTPVDDFVPVSIGNTMAGSWFFGVDSNNKMWGWGQNSFGQMGIGDTTNRLSPIQIGTGEWKSSRGFSGQGSEHSMAIMADGTLWSTGRNHHGQLGLGDLVNRTSWTQVGSFDDWVYCSCGVTNSYAVREGGGLYSCGSNLNGQLGFGDTTERTSMTLVGGGFLMVEGGSGHLLAIKTNRTLWSCGFNSYGQLGIGNNTDSHVLLQVGASTWYNIRCGHDCSFAINQDGSVWSFGKNEHGQLGHGDMVDRNSPVKIGTATDWVECYAGNFHAMLLNANGSLYGMGDNGIGSLGLGIDPPYEIESPTFIKDGVSIAACSRENSALIEVSNAVCDCPEEIGDGFALWGWGSTARGILANGSDAFSYETEPFRMNNEEWVSIQCGDRFTVGLRNDGSIWTCGNNTRGSLGHGDNDNNGDEAFMSQVESDFDWNKIAAGADTVLAIKADGTLWGWGDCGEGQLGLGITDNTSLYAQIFRPTQIGTDDDWAWIATAIGSSGSSFAIKTDGTLWSCGSNSNGQLGHGTFTNPSDATNATFAQVGVATNWAKVSAGRDEVIAVRTDGTLWAWGQGASGQLGLGSPAGFGNRKNVPTQVGVATDWATPEAAREFTFAIKTNGTLWASGDNVNGDLGIGNTTQQNNFVQVGSDAWSKISAGSTFAIGLKTDGSMWGWGLNDACQLGQGVTSSVHSSPISIGDDNQWGLVEASGATSIAFRLTSTTPEPPSGVATGASGGSYIESGGNSIHTLYGDQDFVVHQTIIVDYLVVGAGGEAGGIGGGSGGQVTKVTGVTLAPGTYQVSVGKGGETIMGAFPTNSTQGADGQPSQFRSTIALGGVGGGGFESASQSDGKNGRNGAGGGNSDIPTNGIGGTGSSGRYGGNGKTAGSHGSAGGGGAGEGGAGQNASGASLPLATGGDGGPGVNDSISGASKSYGAGGAGGGYSAGGTGGSSVGGDGQKYRMAPLNNFAEINGKPNTGSGGGGGYPGQYRGHGGHGVVIISYPTPP